MSHVQGTQHSFWKTTGGGVSYPKLAEDIEVDTAVIGGGISGVLAAYCLAKAGKSVAIVEAREFAAGSTGGTTAKLSAQHQLIYHDMIGRDGVDTAKQYYKANEDGLDFIRSIVEEHSIDCDFTDMDSYVFSEDGSHTASLRSEADAYKQIGVDGGLTDSVPLDFKVASALVMRKQAEFHPVKFLHGVLREIDRMGGKIYQHTRYMDKEYHSDRLNLTTDTPFTITCKQAVLATLFPVEDPHSFYTNTLKPMTSHLTAFNSDKALDRGMYISDDDPKRTFRGAYDGNQPILIVGGDTHPTGNGKSTIDHYESISEFAKAEFGLTEMLAYWSEHDLMTPDRRPFIGPIEEGDDKMYVMTGYSKWGLAISGTAAQLITDLITGQQNEYEELLSPQRRQPDEEQEKTDSEPSLSELADRLHNGQAKKFKQDGEPAGMYKDHNSTIHYVDLSCTHLGCEVSWNDGDETWDCPCHGSVFKGSGEVIAGPAKEPLKGINPF